MFLGLVPVAHAAADATLVNTATSAVGDVKDVFVALWVSATLVIILGIIGSKWIFSKVKSAAFGGGRKR